MSKSKEQITDFQVCGQLLGFVVKDGYKIKYLRVNVDAREYWFKLPKDLRSQINEEYVPGCWLNITGYSQKCLKTGKVKLKALEVNLVQKEKLEQTISIPISNASNPQTSIKANKIRLLICNKSSCRKRGGDSVCRELQTQIEKRGLQAQAEIKLTGCLKKCKKGPNLVITPNKTFYSEVKPKQVPLLLEKHLSVVKN